MDKEVKELLKNFESEFVKKLKCAKAMYPDENEMALAKMCLRFTALEFRPLSDDYRKIDKELAHYL